MTKADWLDTYHSQKQNRAGSRNQWVSISLAEHLRNVKMSIKWSWVTRKEDKQASLRISEGKFEGVVYSYGKVVLPVEHEMNGKGDLPFKFEYSILDNANINREEFGEDFFKIIGDILVDIIDEQLQEENLEYRPDD